MRRLWMLLLPLLLWGQEDFISHYEYGEMLYANPRGVSCSQCHGKSGEGQIIVEFRDIHGKQALKGSDIRKDSLDDMIKSVNNYHKIMPRYYLTDEEVKAIYDYLQKKNEVYLEEFTESNTTQ
ncbi:MAG: cytochrome c [Sulfurovum sp.]|uniref:c-type cytochrome n=1 Tax=Sulfurovum sp. TaxID=1969726 RepID=UPI002867E026|nr:cytochrome c [Sulfurovum sp.]MCO4846231.1 cytochrome c [Sulfurovum sp.]